MSKQAQNADWPADGLFVLGAPLAFMGIGPMELVVIFGVAVVLACGLCLLLAISKSARWAPPETTGPPKQLRFMTPVDAPISAAAKWSGKELVVQAHEKGTHKLFEVELPQMDQCRLTYRLLMSSEEVRGVYLEMWCRILGKGEFFSRGLDQKVRGTNNWLHVETPFYLQKGQCADLLKLNLVFEGPGTVRVKDIEVISEPIV